MLTKFVNPCEAHQIELGTCIARGRYVLPYDLRVVSAFFRAVYLKHPEFEIALGDAENPISHRAILQLDNGLVVLLTAYGGKQPTIMLRVYSGALRRDEWLALQCDQPTVRLFHTGCLALLLEADGPEFGVALVDTVAGARLPLMHSPKRKRRDERVTA